ncbi:amidohydrolase family protein [Shinella zoogloeoides]|uniref:Amidohydrolase family protein n=1 Tax=Shinella zoogloeoides TaxID=352475 RepID=A0A6N8TB68_SHIZO|nr:amidohydrolase family protein [Shinella zoogloeoides]MXN99684.1 amidohydrolase family protein [Shinella zoogloeoides]UEX80817.1 amidohydrolase family protein [Shinella zoogloeoides]
MTLSDLVLGRRPEGRTALFARWIVAHENGRHRLLTDGEIVIEGQEVIYVGPRFPGEVARRIELGDTLVSPGFVDLDALSDLDTTVLTIDYGPGWAKGRVWPRSYVDRGPYEMYTPEQLVFQKRFAFAQLLLNGITSALPIASLFYREWAETAAEFEGAADAAGDLGLRVWLGPAYRSGGMVCEAPGVLEPVFDEARGLKGLEDAIAFAGRIAGRHEGLVQAMLAPDRVETSTLALLQRTMAASAEMNLPVRLHMAQGKMERQTVARLHGTTAPQWMARHGLLNERLIAPHAVEAEPEDLDLYARHGVTIAHCPLVYARGGEYLNAFRRCRDLGIRVGMGTDTTPPDMVLNMAVALMTGRIASGEDGLSTAEVFDAATLGGADALGRSDIGRLQPGSKADIAIFDLSDPRFAPTVDPVQSLIFGATGRVTRAVFVDGRLSMLDGEVAGIDIKAARRQAQAQFDGLVAKYPERAWGHPSVESMFPPTYPHLKAE